MTLAFLAGYRPAMFDTSRDATEPYCTSCGGPAGIFLGHGTGWRHFHGAVSGGDRAEVYDTDHAPAIGWRQVGNGSACGDGAR